MPLRGSHIAAAAIAAGIAGWMWSGTVIIGGEGAGPVQNVAGAASRWLSRFAEKRPAADGDAGATIAAREAERTSSLFKVRVVSVSPSERLASLDVRGRTEADARVEVKTETAGTVEERFVLQGQMVKAGDALCTIDQGTREATLAQARAGVEQAQADYDANAQLLKRGFTTRSRVRSLKTALDAAKAQLAQAQQEMKRTAVVAPIAGRVEKPMAEVGDVLQPGGTCATIVDADPMLFTGQIAEREINAVSVGMPVDVALINGTNAKGEIRFVAPTADEATRTFRIEAALENGDGTLQEGLTARATVPLAPVQAYKLEPSWLTLDDSGEIGVRVVDGEDKVAFRPVRIIAQEGDGAWVAGLEPGARVITLGQNFVSIGETVEAVVEPMRTAKVSE